VEAPLGIDGREGAEAADGAPGDPLDGGQGGERGRTGVTLLPQPGQMAMEDLAAAGPDDVALVVGVRRRAALTDQVLAYLRDREVPTAYFTDHRAATATRLATWNFRCQSRGVSLFDSYVAMMSVMNYFCTEVVAESGEDGRTQLARIEEALDMTGEILSGN
jgi:DNA-binding MurR/RpiR family transcriptional regulator